MSGPVSRRLERQLQAVRGRMRLLSALGFTTNVLFAAVGLSVLMVVVGRVADWTELFYWAAAPVAVALVAGAIWWGLRRPKRLDAAARVDLELDFRERLSTMVHLEAHPTGSQIDRAQRDDAVRRAETLAIARVSPVRAPARARYLVLPLVVAAAALLYPAGGADPDAFALAAVGAGAAGGGRPRALTDQERKKFDARQDVLNDPALSEAEKIAKLRELGVPILAAPEKKQTPGEILERIREALTRTDDPQRHDDQGDERRDATSQSGAGEQLSASSDPDGPAGGADALQAPGAAELPPLAPAAAVITRDYPEYADVLRRYFGRQASGQRKVDSGQ